MNYKNLVFRLIPVVIILIALWFLPAKCTYIDNCGKVCYNIYDHVIEECKKVGSAQEALELAKQTSCGIDHSKDVKVFRDQEIGAYIVREDACDVYSLTIYDNGTKPSCKVYRC